MENKEERFEITELFMYKAGQNWHRRYMGTIKRLIGNNGNHFVCGQVEVNNCLLYAQADNEELLGDKLDELVLMVLDLGLHSMVGKTTIICESDIFLN